MLVKSENCFVYDAGLIDFFNGLWPLQSFIDSIYMNQENNINIEEFKEWLTDIIELVLKCGAESHHREIHVGALPTYLPNDFETELLVVYKQDNNGSTFVISPRQLSFYDSNLDSKGGNHKKAAEGIVGSYDWGNPSEEASCCEQMHDYANKAMDAGIQSEKHYQVYKREILHRHLKRMGKYAVGLCPFHEEKTPSLNYDAFEDEFYCFGCGEKGDSEKLSRAYDAIE